MNAAEIEYTFTREGLIRAFEQWHGQAKAEGWPEKPVAEMDAVVQADTFLQMAHAARVID